MFRTLKMKCLVSVWVFLWCLSQAVYADAPNLINFQGRLSDSDGNPRSGTVSLSFEIYDAQSNGNLLWGPQSFDDVELLDGYFNVILGNEDESSGGDSIDVAFNTEQTYLQIIAGSVKIEPRQKVLSTPYALHATSATHGVPKGTIVMWSGKISDIPYGWALCDGSNGTPNLLDKFVKSVSSASETPGETGGSATTEHQHSIGIYKNGNFGQGIATDYDWPYWENASPTGNQRYFSYFGPFSRDKRMLTAPTVLNNLPPYYSIAFIIKL